MKAVLIAGGTVSENEKIKEYADDSVVICADSGYDYAKQIGIVPDIVIGDMDSVKSSEIATREIIYPKKKDFTDSELIMQYATENGYDELFLFGFTGTRTDHTLTNLFLLFNYPKINAVIIDRNNEIRILKDKNIIFGKKGDIISIVPVDGNIEGVTVKNLEYPLNNETLYFGMGRGVSNIMTGDFCEIFKKAGKGLIIKAKD